MILIDSNIVIDLLEGNKDIADKINKLHSFYIPSIVVGELFVGVFRVSNKSKHLKILNSFLQLCTILEVNLETAMNYGEIVADLFKKGKPIPTNDIWIAAIAKQHHLTLITKDKHFKEVESIKLKYW